MGTKWIFNSSGSKCSGILDGKNFHIMFFDPSLFIFSINEIRETTIIIPTLNNKSIFLKLNGDFCHEYEFMIDKGLESCIEFYNEMKSKNTFEESII